MSPYREMDLFVAKASRWLSTQELQTANRVDALARQAGSVTRVPELIRPDCDWSLASKAHISKARDYKHYAVHIYGPFELQATGTACCKMSRNRPTPAPIMHAALCKMRDALNIATPEQRQRGVKVACNDKFAREVAQPAS